MDTTVGMALPSEPPCPKADSSWEPVVPPEIKCLVNCAFCEKNLSLNADEIRNAKLLLCLHSICKSCADSWENGEKKTCPRCHLSLSKLLEENKLVQEFIQEPPPESFLKGMCNEHVTTPARKWCNECACLVCNTCIETHQNLTISRSHRIVDIDDAEATSGTTLVDYSCPDHRPRDLDVYCNTCDHMTCRDCQLEKHKTHNYSFVKMMTEEFKKDLCFRLAAFKMYEDMVNESIKQGMILQVDLHHQKLEALKEINSVHKGLLERLNSRFEKLKQDLELLVVSKQNVIRKKLKSSSQFLDSLKNIYHVFDLIASESSDKTIVFLRKHLLRSAEFVKCCPETEILNPEARDKIEFVYAHQINPIRTSIKNFGSVNHTRINILDSERRQSYSDRLKDVNDRFTQSLIPQPNAQDKPNAEVLGVPPPETPKRIHVRNEREILVMENPPGDPVPMNPGGAALLWHKPTDLVLSNKAEQVCIQEPAKPIQPSPPSGVTSTTDIRTLNSSLSAFNLGDPANVDDLNRAMLLNSLSVNTDCQPTIPAFTNTTSVTPPCSKHITLEKMLASTSYVASPSSFSVPVSAPNPSIQQRVCNPIQSHSTYTSSPNRYNHPRTQSDNQGHPIPGRKPQRSLSVSSPVQGVPQSAQLRRTSDSQGPPSYQETLYAPYNQPQVLQQIANAQLSQQTQLPAQNTVLDPAPPQANFELNHYRQWY